jgi:MFS family permease
MPAEEPKSFSIQLVPYLLSFLASFCIMAVEVASGRIVARYVGAGLYTWTSVIGVVLGGITLGNLVGGRLADRFEARKTLAVLFFCAACPCLGIPLVNFWVAKWMSWELVSSFPFPARVATHVALVFFLPAASLGLIGPVVAKLALTRGQGTGRTVGNVYAWGALGSILGTFVTGFYLISACGTAGVVLCVGGLLGAMGLALSPTTASRLLVVAWPLLAGSIAGFFLTAGRGLGEWVWLDGQLRVRERGAEDWVYVEESQYSFIRVTENKAERTRSLLLDFLLHAVYMPEDENQLQYDFAKVYATLTERISGGRSGFQALVLGGGGYVFPRYIQTHWPGSKVQVAEIDPAVTRANLRAFGLKKENVRIFEGRGLEDAAQQLAEKEAGGGLGTASPAGTPIEIYHLDARNHVDDLLKLRREGKAFKSFDFVYGDAFNDYSVPFHLVTLEFTQKIKDVLRPQTGVYLLNLIDIYHTGRFLGAVYNTLHQVFPYVYIITNNPGGPKTDPLGRDTYIVLGALQALDLTGLGTRQGEEPFSGSILEEKHIKHLQECSSIVLTDDYSPVENLLDEVVRRRAQKQPSESP